MLDASLTPEAILRPEMVKEYTLEVEEKNDFVAAIPSFPLSARRIEILSDCFNSNLLELLQKVSY